MTDLKPCPFCGSEAEMKHEVSPEFGDIYNVQCECLRAQTQLYRTEAEAIAAWNARAERTCEEIVCCRDCEHYEDYGGCCMRRYQPMAVTPDGFCAWAERRERQNLTENG